MLFRLDNPRLVMNAQEFPENMVLYCLAYADCAGDVIVNFVDPQGGRRVTRPITPTRSLIIFSSENVWVHEYVLPFNELVDTVGRRGATSGFTVIGRSSYRVAGADYQVRTLEFTMIFPVIGGGVIRIRAGDQEWDIANPTFNPRAAIPEINQSYGSGRGDEYVSGPLGIDNSRVPNDVLINAYQRTHRGFIGSHGNEIEQRRQQRVRNFDLNESIPEPTPPLDQSENIHAPAYSPRTNVVTGNQREIETGSSRSPAQVQAEERRQSRLNQLDENYSTTPMIIGIDPASQGTSSVSILTTDTRKPKDPPKTRFERVKENIEESNEPEK